MSQPALICDTGALIDYLVAAAPDHDAFRQAIDAARARYIPGLVLAEALPAPLTAVDNYGRLTVSCKFPYTDFV